MKPFAFELYDRFRKGETIEELAAALRIPAERVAVRIRVAEMLIRQNRRKAA